MVLNKEVVLDYNKEDLGFDTYSTWRRLKKEKKVTLKYFTTVCAEQRRNVVSLKFSE